ncbi:MAG: hypothetical protein QG656_1949 [Candidatus Hydrogenedentes bacterium]|nr:hypothetical protein [Candidatus Hydrogenedentota bacterium]
MTSKWMLLLAASVLFACSSWAVSGYQADARDQYPGITGSKLDSCTLCHTSVPSRNAYGTAFKNANNNFASIEGQDSDGDGASNFDEIVALTYPGDATDFPQAQENPFDSLTADGDMWVRTVSVPGGSRIVGYLRYDANSANATAVLSIENPADPAQVVTITVPKALLQAGETGIAILEFADSLDLLYGTNGAQALLPEPAGMALIPGGVYAEVSFVVTTDGAVYAEVDPARVAANPIRLKMTGLAVDTTLAPALHGHETAVTADPATGIAVAGAAGAWSVDHAANVVFDADALHADLTGLSVFAPYEQAPAETPGCFGGFVANGPSHGSLGDLVLLVLTAALLFAAGRRFSPLPVSVRPSA